MKNSYQIEALRLKAFENWQRFNLYLRRIELEKIENKFDQNFFTKPQNSQNIVTLHTLQPSLDKVINENVQKIDKQIAKLEKEVKKSQKGFFSGIFNIFSKKDNKMRNELKQLKKVRANGMKDGKIDLSELNSIIKEFKDAEKSLGVYKSAKKAVADIVSTVVAIAATIAVNAIPGVGTVASIALAAAASATAKVASKEAMLGYEYDALGKEGIKDALISAAYGATGAATSAVSRVARFGSAAKVALGTSGDVGLTLAFDENARKELLNGNFTRVAVIATTSAAFRYVGTRIDAIKGSITSDVAKESLEEAANNTVRETTNKAASKFILPSKEKLLLTYGGYTTKTTLLDSLS
ncbi:MAG: hypothetical protein AB1782_06525 [Cyanobacteriota bacterium]